MKKVIYISIAIFSLLLFSTSNTEALTIDFSPASQNAIAGDSVSIDLTISGLGTGTAPSLKSYDLDILFDPTILAFNTAVFGTGLDIWSLGLNLANASLAAPNILNIWELSFSVSDSDLNTFQPANFVLATLIFDTLSIGNSSLDISLAGGSNFLSGTGGEILVANNLVSGNINVSSANPIPEPSTFILLFCGLIAVVILRKKIGRQVACRQKGTI